MNTEKQAEAYRELKATMKGRLEGINRFLDAISEDDKRYPVYFDALAVREELEYLDYLIETLEQ